VYQAAVVRVGTGTREIGDRLLIDGDRAVVVQVKSRAQVREDETRERAWVVKHVRRGLKQAHGTIRRFGGGRFEATNGRERTLQIDGGKLRWLAVVVIDHAAVPDEITPNIGAEPNPSVVILRRDWEFLFEQLKSTHAVIRYLERVAGQPWELGDEVLRYFDLAQADAATAPAQPDPRLASLGGRHFSSPLLPMLPVATTEDRAHGVVRLIFEDIATAKTSDEYIRLRVLAALDRLPVSLRALVGAFLLDAMAAVSRAPFDTTEWRLRSVREPWMREASIQLGFGVCSAEHSDMIQDVFSSWVQLRHHDLWEAVGGDEDLVTVAVVLTPRHGVRPWDTTLVAVAGDPRLDAEQLAVYRGLWPRDGS
jgi:hypothetical protein